MYETLRVSEQYLELSASFWLFSVLILILMVTFPEIDQIATKYLGNDADAQEFNSQCTAISDL